MNNTYYKPCSKCNNDECVFRGSADTHKLCEDFTEWTPVSERLPKVMEGTNGECSDDVQICVEDDEQITISTGFYGYYPNSKSQQGWWSVWAYGCHKLDSKYKVVAWQPLPEPYVPDTNVGKKAESEE